MNLNRTTKYIIGAVILLCIFVGAYTLTRPSQAVEYGIDLLINGSFDRITQEELPDQWLPDAYNRIPGITTFTIGEGVQGNAIHISSLEGNDARFTQNVPVKPNTVYELSGYIKADARMGRGASLSIADVYTSDTGLHDTNGEWERFTVYGRTARDQEQLTVFARLGGYSAESSGDAWFDDITLKAVKDLPDGVTISSWETYSPAQQPELQNATAAKPAWPWLLLIAAVYLCLAVWMARRAHGEEPTRDLSNDRKIWTSGFWFLILFSVFSRLLLAILVPGYGVDIGCFTSWANRMDAVGPLDFYITEAHSDYPPGYMLVLWPLGTLGRLQGTGATTLMVKLPALLADLAAIAVLYAFANKHANHRTSLLITAIFALNPLSYVTGPAWGQVDSIPALLLMVVILLALRHRWDIALPVYVLAVLMKPQALMFGPLGLVALIVDLIDRKEKGRWKPVIVGASISAVLALAVVLPFSPKQEGWDWLVKLYGGTMGYYGYATVNATNLHFLFGLNWQPVAQGAPWMLRLLGALCLILPTLGYIYLPKKSTAARKEIMLLLLSLLPAAVVAVVPMSLSLTGTLLMVSAFLLITIRYVAARSMTNLPLLGAVLLILFCNLGSMMHERYLFPTLILLTMAYVLRRDRSIFWLLMGASLLTFLNVGVVLDRGIRITGVEGHLESPLFGIVSESAWLEYALSALQVLLAGAALYVGMVQSHPEAPVRGLPAVLRTAEGEAKDGDRLRISSLLPREKLLLKPRDYVIMLGLTGLYALLALTNLGSTKAPQRPWVSEYEEPAVILDLGEEHSFNVLYYGGIHWRDSDFEVAVSSDQINWLPQLARMEDGDCFAWRYQTELNPQGSAVKYNSIPMVHQGRYVRIQALQMGTTLMEMKFRDTLSGEFIQPTLLTDSGAALIDEQNTLDGEPSWFNSMYFDEIYHGRTAYEHLNAMRGLEPNATYETSHPPLGKVLMSFAIAIFGMTPFGWRFAGAMAGVLMLPGMYLLGLLLTRRRGIGVVALLLLAFDTMHFTQTRIATIDSFSTLFIIWAYYYMFRYAVEEGLGGSHRRMLRLLGLSGLFMGLSIASKWTGMYAGLGLAVIFFWTQWRSAKTSVEIEHWAGNEPIPADLRDSAKAWRQRILTTMLWCILFFIIIPAVIYYASFLPWFMRTPGGLTPKKVIDASISMFNYHAEPGRGMDHYYYSPWYQWPVIAKPMWFYSSKVIDGMGSSIITFGNPAVWWGGLLALLWLVVTLVRREGSGRTATADRQFFQIGAILVLIGALAQYIPWIPVPRGTYIYHYFPTVPFIILAVCLVLNSFIESRPRLGWWTAGTVAAAAAVLFIAFFPYASGLRVSTQWLDAMKWFPQWLYY